MFTEDDLLPISALQHLLFCRRQCALIHVEGLWAENRLTVEGQHLHEKTHAGPDETRYGVRITRGMPLRSFTLGLSGQADVVEFHRDESGGADRVIPVEYKRGRPKPNAIDEVQLCAQALCLEEMLQCPVQVGYLFYGTTRRRTEIAIDEPLRQITRAAAGDLHQLIASGLTPPARREPKCDNCSLLELCVPHAMTARASARRFIKDALAHALTHGPPASTERDP